MVSVLNTIDTAHEDMIHGAEVDYYGLRLGKNFSSWKLVNENNKLIDFTFFSDMQL